MAVAASTDDVRFSTATANLTYYDPSATAQLAPGQQLALASSRSGFYRVQLGEVVADPTKEVLIVAGTNFAPFARHGDLLCRYGPAVLARPEAAVCFRYRIYAWVPVRRRRRSRCRRGARQRRRS